jgi:hypothetical protein
LYSSGENHARCEIFEDDLYRSDRSGRRSSQPAKCILFFRLPPNEERRDGDWHYKSNQDEVVPETKHGLRQANTFRAPWIARSAASATGQSLRVGRNRSGAFNR